MNPNVPYLTWQKLCRASLFIVVVGIVLPILDFFFEFLVFGDIATTPVMGVAWMPNTPFAFANGILRKLATVRACFNVGSLCGLIVAMDLAHRRPKDSNCRLALPVTHTMHDFLVNTMNQFTSLEILKGCSFLVDPKLQVPSVNKTASNLEALLN